MIQRPRVVWEQSPDPGKAASLLTDRRRGLNSAAGPARPRLWTAKTLGEPASPGCDRRHRPRQRFTSVIPSEGMLHNRKEWTCPGDSHSGHRVRQCGDMICSQKYLLREPALSITLCWAEHRFRQDYYPKRSSILKSVLYIKKNCGVLSFYLH